MRAEHGPDATGDTYRLAMQAPLLVIYPDPGARAREPEDQDGRQTLWGGLLLPALGAHFPGLA